MTVADPDERRAFKARVQAILAGRERLRVSDPELRCAAVLLPLLWKRGQWHVAVTQRTNHVEHHRGQISFPGGACEPQDRSLLDTALRETYEEIGVPPEAVEVLGTLDDFPTITYFVVTPFVGVIPHPFDYRINEAEVEAVVEVPLSFLLEPTHVRMEEREHEGQMYELLFWDYQEGDRTYTIWGATARTLRSFLDLVA